MQTGDHASGAEAMGDVKSSEPVLDVHDQKTRRVRVLLPLVLLAAVVLVGVMGWRAFGPATIRQGMTRAEVDALLGPPNGRMLAVAGTPIKEVVLVWKDRGLVVEFDDEDRVRKVDRPPTLFGNLRRLIGF